jgi:histidine triad (HIT) family protein
VEVPLIAGPKKVTGVPMKNDCVFCRIVNKRTDTAFLYEDDALTVFRDINPHAPVHLLIVPKRHIRSINDLTGSDQEIIGRMIFTARDMAKQEQIHRSGYRLFFNVEHGGGQVIFHLHLHLIGGWKRS